VVCRLACWSGCWRQEPHQARADIAARGLPLPVPCPLQLAAAAGVPVVLDAGGATDPLSPGLLRCLAVISPNETELQGLTGGFGGACRVVLVGQHRCLLYRSQWPAQRRVHLAHMRACTLSPCAQQACPLTVRTGLRSCAERAHMHTSLRRALQACPPRVRRRLWRRRMRCAARESTRCL
jgi:hypothetical protein